jgi:hypothetical protein
MSRAAMAAWTGFWYRAKGKCGEDTIQKGRDDRWLTLCSQCLTLLRWSVNHTYETRLCESPLKAGACCWNQEIIWNVMVASQLPPRPTPRRQNFDVFTTMQNASAAIPWSATVFQYHYRWLWNSEWCPSLDLTAYHEHALRGSCSL